MMSLCGSPLWDWNLTWYSDNPDFTPCFEQTVLAWIPLLFLWIFFGIDLYDCLKSSRARNIPWNALNAAKIGVTCVIIIIHLYVLILQGYFEVEYDQIVYPAYRWTPILRILTLGLYLFLIIFCKTHGIRSSGVQFLFWLLMAICGAFAFRTTIEVTYEELPVDIGFLTAELVYYPFVLAAFLLNCWADAAPSAEDEAIAQRNLSPEAHASFPSRIFFFWFEGLVWKGYRKPLTTSDLWDLNPEDKSSALVPVFDKHWRHAKEKVVVYETKGGSIKEQPPSKTQGGKKSKPVSILPTLISLFGPTLLSGACLKLTQDLLAFASPQVLKLLIAFVENKDAANGDAVWKGYFYAVLLLIAASLQTLLVNQYFLKMFLAGMRVRTTLVNLVYRKSLVISSAARKESTTGEIVNLQSVDAQRFMDMLPYFNMIWSAPFQIVLSIYFLWGVIGPSVCAGLGVMILLIPVNAYIASKVEVLQVKQMELKDSRIKQMNEILSGIKVLKLYAWENSFAAQVMDIREHEMKVLKHSAYINAGTTFVWNCAPFLVAIASFACFVLTDPNNVLDAQTAFVALSLFNILRFPMAMLPMTISTLIQANVSLKRLNKFMNADEIDPTAVSHDSKEKDPIVIERGNFSWDPADPVPLLKDINIRISKGSLVAICGSVGSGKSSMLSALLGEMFKNSGRVNTKGSFAYVAQQAWIQNATVRDNILFGAQHEHRKYDKVLNACALKPDLEILTAGDRTEIGEKGINLSGGQKQRISLARAVYNDADVYLLDDPLSAVDSHVGKHIFEHVVGPNGLLKNKTRVLVTHAVTYLPQVDKIIVLKDGEITEVGSYRELLDKKGAFAEFLVQHMGEGAESEAEDEEESAILHDIEEVVGIKVDRTRRRTLSRGISELSDGGEKMTPRKASITRQESRDDTQASSMRRRRLSSGSGGSFSREIGSFKSIPEEEKLIQEETTQVGNVSWTIYMHYLKAIGWGMTFLTCLAYAAFQGLAVATDLWLSVWSTANTGHLNENGTKVNAENQEMYLGVYGALGIGQGFGTLTASMVFAFASLRASNALHSGMLQQIIRAPMSFFDTVPLGRIINRFSKDVDVCDNTLRMNFETFLSCFLNVVAVFVVISYSTPIFMVVIPPVGIVYSIVQRLYVANSRQLKRLESVSRSPIYSHFSETLTGCTTIRAYDVQKRFTLESEAKVDLNQKAYYPSLIANRWLSVRLETVGNFIIFFAALFAVLQRDTLSPGLVGLSISYALEVTQVLNWMVRMSSALETDIVAVERIQEYSDVPQEAPWDIAGRKPSYRWPERGELVFSDYQTRYRDGLDLVLRNVNCRILPAEKVGVVGRTGAGKSSLTLALFRIIEPVHGTILVDGQDICQMGLHDLRSRLTIIPQDPVLFSGSLRINLDPFSIYSDEMIWRALELAHLKTFAKGLASGLQHEVAEGGENLSVGQRQLICLARALLRKTKILVLDEATAAVDLETDDLIQQTIRTEFKDCTIITIAHRLNTILDSTRVIVLDKGEIREFDTPGTLLKNKNSVFYGMAKNAGLV